LAKDIKDIKILRYLNILFGLGLGRL